MKTKLQIEQEIEKLTKEVMELPEDTPESDTTYGWINALRWTMKEDENETD